jgi:hypothetical protein
MIIQRFAFDGQRFGCIWRRHRGGKNGLSRWLWVGNVVTPVVYFIGNRSAEILIDALPGSLKCYRPTNRYFLLEEASVGEAQLAGESNTVGGIIRIEKSGPPADIRRAVVRLHQRLQGAQYGSLRRPLVVWINRASTSPADARPGDPGSQRTTGDRRHSGGSRRSLDKAVEGRKLPRRPPRRR